MKSAAKWVPTLVAYLTLNWQESCENPALFCYRIGSGLLSKQRSRRGGASSPSSCSNLFASFSGHSTTSRD